MIVTVLCSFTMSAARQDNIVSAKLVDKNDGSALGWATVAVRDVEGNITACTTTDENGEGSDGEIRRDAPNPNFYRMERDVWTRFCEQSQSGLLTEELADRNWNLWKEQRWKLW